MIRRNSDVSIRMLERAAASGDSQAAAALSVELIRSGAFVPYLGAPRGMSPENRAMFDAGRFLGATILAGYITSPEDEAILMPPALVRVIHWPGEPIEEDALRRREEFIDPWWHVEPVYPREEILAITEGRGLTMLLVEGPSYADNGSEELSDIWVPLVLSNQGAW